jgi:gliding motility-associated-like protein
MKIFDRWGQLIFDTKDLNEGWDGKYKGKIVQIDTYVYVIDYKTECSGEQTKKEIGHVNVIK